MTEAGAPSIYESGEYLARSPEWHAGGAPFKAAWIAALLGKNGLVPARIVEIGCGSGEILVRLAETFPSARLEGWDISPQAHAIAAPKTTDRLAFHLGDWRPADADLTMAIDVFEHVEDYIGFLRRMQRVKGHKLFHIPLDLSVQGMLRVSGIMHGRKVDGHLHYFCKETALATLQDCGFEVIDWEYTHGAEQLPNRPLRTRLFNIPRRLARIVLGDDLAVRIMGGASLLVLAR